jgi:uncharacterized protein YbjQ (UPF0145 family)
MNKPEQYLAVYEENMAKMPEWARDLLGGTSFSDIIVNNGLQIISVAVAGWLIATWFEHRHNKDMARREISLQDIHLNNFKRPPACEPEQTTMLIGSVVIAHDYFRTLTIAIRKLIGGNIQPYERLVTRGRREALIRLREEASMRKLDTVINVRFTSSLVSGKFLSAVELVAYGTGVKTHSTSG